MSKPLAVFYGPVDTFSGYGARARDLIISIIKNKDPEWDIKIIECNWGACPKGFLQEDNPDHKLVIDRILPGAQLPKQPEVWMMCTVPNEMQKLGSIRNILFTAGLEAYPCPAEWIEGCNRADLVIVSSNHSKQIFEQSTFEKRDQRTNQIVDHVKLKTKIEVLFEGIDLNIYQKKVDNTEFNLEDIKEPFAFLCVGTWLQGDFGHDRKGISTLVKVFLESFKNKPVAPALILKTAGASPSIIDREQILEKIDAIRKTVKATTLPNIYLLHGEFTDKEINDIYAHPKVKAFVLLTHGEGFGRPLLEFSVHQKPIITSGWGGALDFLNSDYVTLLPGNMENVHGSAQVPGIFLPESQWFSPNASEASIRMKDMFQNYKSYLDGARRQAYKSRTEFSMEEMDKKLKEILDKNIPPMSQPIKFKLPELKKIVKDEPIKDSETISS